MAQVHPTRRVRHGAMEADVDAEIADLVLACWKRELVTLNSCQDNPVGWVWLQFAHATHAEEFLNVVGEYEKGPHTLYNRIRNRWPSMDGTEIEGIWDYSVLPEDYSVSIEWIDHEQSPVEQQSGEAAFGFTLSIRFPKHDLPTVVERLEKRRL